MKPAPQLWLEPFPSADGEAIEAARGVLSPAEQGWGARLPAPRRQQYWASRAALRRRVGALLGCSPADLPLHAPPGQPPRLLEGAGWLGLSHSGPGLLIGYAMAPLGVDLERADRPLQARALLERFFPELERRQLARLPEGRLREAVLRSWVLKEAAIKWRHRSLALELGCWCFDHHGGHLQHRRHALCAPWRAGLVGRWRWAVVGTGLEQLALHLAPSLLARDGALCHRDG